MTGITARGPIYREPPAPARFFVYGFALSSPLLTLAALFLPAALLARYGTEPGGIAIACVGSVAYVIGLWAAVRRIRRLAARFTPPLALPGDIWNVGVAEPPRRSKNWPIRFAWRRSPDGGRKLAA
jgi:hypothetical protein